MVDLDQFESQFRAALKTRHHFSRPTIDSVLLVTDLPETEGVNLLDTLKKRLQVLGPHIKWKHTGRESFSAVGDMLGFLVGLAPDLLITYRHLFEADRNLPHSLGTYVDILTQASPTPVLLLPDPKPPRLEHILSDLDRIMVVTDHIVDHPDLVNWGLRLIEDGGTLELVHVEDDATFARYMDVIAKVQDINTDIARERIHTQLLKEVQDYLDSVTEAIKKTHPKVTVEQHIRFGHAVREYVALAENSKSNVLVFNTKDDDQLAMHGVAYSLAVEFLEKPLLML